MKGKNGAAVFVGKSSAIGYARLFRQTGHKQAFDINLRAGLRSGRHQQRGVHDPMTSFVNRRQFMIEWGHCDPAGIVFNSRFFEFFDWGTWTLFEAALGVKPHELGATYGIMGIPLVDAGARFLAPARFGDVVELTSRVSEFRRSSFDVEHQLLVHGALAVEGKETRVWAARDAVDPSKIKSQPIPAEVTARFEV
jgi:4-hydroxybenzoyl-CoA thioesterase